MFFIATFAAYLLGAVPFAILFARLFGLPDPRHFGSGNPGATNIARSGGKTAALLTLLADMGKGWLCAVIYAENNSILAAALGAAAVVGHIFPVFLRFKGGKGVATALGVFIGWYWAAGVGALLVWAVVFALCRVSSLSSIIAMIAGALLLIIWAPTPIAIAGGAVVVLVIIRHKRNIADLLRGRENSFGR